MHLHREEENQSEYGANQADDGQGKMPVFPLHWLHGDLVTWRNQDFTRHVEGSAEGRENNFLPNCQ